MTFKKVLELAKPLLFDKKKKEGVIFSSTMPLEYNLLPYTIFGRNKRKAYEIQGELFKLFNSVN